MRAWVAVAAVLAASGCMEGLAPDGEGSDGLASSTGASVAADREGGSSSTSTSPGPTEGDGPGSPTSSTSASTGAAPCQPESPCELPPVDPSPAVQMLANATYHRGEAIGLRLRNVGDRAYVYSQPQATCQVGIHDAHGNRMWLGVCSDYFQDSLLEPGQEAAYLAWWRFQECIDAGPWYGGCDAWRDLPAGAYHLRQTFCPASASSATTTGTSGSSTGPAASPCSRSGVSVQLVA